MKKISFLLLSVLFSCTTIKNDKSDYIGTWIEGNGDTEKLILIDKAFESLDVSDKLTSLSLFYKRDWDGFVLSNTAWPAWWIQNTYGSSYGMMPFLEEPYATWMKHAQGLWYLNMADGKRADANGYVGPDGCLCDCSMIYRNGGRDLGFGHKDWAYSTDSVNDGQIKMNNIYYRQGDAGHDTNDWPIGFTAAGLLLECERLLVTRNLDDIKVELPSLKRTAAFIDSRRDTCRNLLLGGKGSNLLAPSFNGIKGKDGKTQLVFLTELSVNYCAALYKLAEVCKINGEDVDATKYVTIAEKIKDALASMKDEDGSFINFEEIDGTRHGIYGDTLSGYYEATPNHDAVCMEVVNDEDAQKIISKMLAIKELYPHDLIISNYPEYDEKDYPTEGLMKYGTWVHGGHWSTCQGRMNIACLRVNKFEHPFNSWKRMCNLMENFRADAPMGEFGLTPWNGQLAKPHNTVMDCWGIPAGLLRGLFEYNYQAHGLKIRPHIPNGITKYVQKKAVIFGNSKIYITVRGNGKIISALANGQECTVDQEGWVFIDDSMIQETILLEIVCGMAEAKGAWEPSDKDILNFPDDNAFLQIPEELQNKYHVDFKNLKMFYDDLKKEGLENTYEGAMAKTALHLMLARYNRIKQRESGTLQHPDIRPIPSCNLEAVEDYYVFSAQCIAGGITDRLLGLTIWKEPEPNQRILEIAKKNHLFPRMRK